MRINNKEEEDLVLKEVNNRLEEAIKLLGEVRENLALEIGRNERWQSMFEDLATAVVILGSWVKKTYLTKQIQVTELEHIYVLADKIEQTVLAYQKRKTLVDMGQMRPEEVNNIGVTVSERKNKE